MSERLFIRLGAYYAHSCHWVRWSEQELTVIDHGVIENAGELHSLSNIADDHPVDVFVSSAALTLTQVALPKTGQKQALKALPFMLEETLVDDIDNLHFVIGPREGEKVDVIAVSHEQMQQWLSWLHDANLKPRQLIPDCLALPMAENKWAALHFDDEYLIRTSEGVGMSLPGAWLDALIPQLIASCGETETISVATYSDIELPGTESHPQPFELPLLVLSKGLAQAPVDLLTGAYKPKREISKHLMIWRNVAIVAGIAIVLSLANKGLNIYQMQSQIADLKAQTTRIYRQAVPSSSRIVNLRSQLGAELKKLQNQGGGGEFFSMLNNLQTPFLTLPDIKLTGLRFDSKRNEMRMQVSAKSYGQIEQFSELASKTFKTDTGSMNSLDNHVTSTLTLRNL